MFKLLFNINKQPGVIVSRSEPDKEWNQLKQAYERDNERTYHVVFEEFFQFKIENLNDVMIE